MNNKSIADELICGIKFTHDGGVALIKNGKLLFSIEIEKINNNPRYSSLEHIETVASILADYGLTFENVDHFVIDGWGGLDESEVSYKIENRKICVPVAGYHEKRSRQDMLAETQGVLPVKNGLEVEYDSFLHLTGHIAGAYCSSPFAKKKEDSYVLVWDGGTFPRLYLFEANKRAIKILGKLSFITGNFYAVFSSYFGPFKKLNPERKDDLSIAGKVMAYIAKGNVREDIISEFENILNNHLDLSMEFVHKFVAVFKSLDKFHTAKDEDILASMHQFLERQLIRGLRKKMDSRNGEVKNLCYAGGCALNIKWNSAIRATRLFEEVWIPPFPNDSGSALGTACVKMLKNRNYLALDWEIFNGPRLGKAERRDNWNYKPCTIEDLGKILSRSSEPVVVLQDEAELGPRALGNRSIIAPATTMNMKGLLNQVKNRESYRPVAPICLEDDAQVIFTPGTPDPYMLFEHSVKDSWKDLVPAICHLDGSARLQTVSKVEYPILFALLQSYKQETGIPVLCNTSANYNGSGFFPDIQSVMDWGKVNLIWSGGQIYFNDKSKELSSYINTTTLAATAE